MRCALRIALRIGGTGGHRKPSLDTVFFRRPGFRANGEPAKAREEGQLQECACCYDDEVLLSDMVAPSANKFGLRTRFMG